MSEMTQSKPVLRLGFIFFFVLTLGLFAHFNFQSKCKDGKECNLICYQALNKNELGRAARFCSLAIRKDPSFTWSYGNLCAVRIAQGRIVEGMNHCNKAIEIDPQYVTAYVNRANAKNILGDYAGAIKDYKTALDLAPTSYTLMFNIASLQYTMKDFAGAASQYKTLAEEYPNFKHIHYYIARALELTGDLAGARENFEQELSSANPHSHTAWDLARLLFNLGNYEDACIVYNKYRGASCSYFVAIRQKMMEYEAIVKDNKEKGVKLSAPYFDLGNINVMLADYPKALDNFSNAAKITPNYTYYNEIAWTKIKMGDYAGARPYAEQALIAAPKDGEFLAETYDTAAVASYGVGKFAAALEYHNKAIALKPSDKDLYKTRAVTLAASGDYLGAQDNLNKVKSLQEEDLRPAGFIKEKGSFIDQLGSMLAD